MLGATLGCFDDLHLQSGRQRREHRICICNCTGGGACYSNSYLSQEEFLMSTSKSIRRAVQCALWTGAGAAMATQSVYAAEDENIQEVVVTGTRISVPGAVSSSPILSIGADEIQL